MTKKEVKIITALSIIAFILAFMVSNRIWFRLDFTKTKAHTISKVSRNLHTEIPDYVNITYFLSNRLKTVIPSPGEIEDMLREYAAHSKGKIRVTVRDPVRSGLVSTAEDFGLQPRQVQTVEQDQASLVTVYSGIVIEYLDKIEVLPWVISTDTLEYDLTSRIRSMVTDTERQLGIIIGDSFRQPREDFGFLHRMLSEAGYRVRYLFPGEEIPDNLPALFVLGGTEDLDLSALYRIDRYIQLGGKVLFAVKGVYIDTMSGSIEARPLEDQGLIEMIASYGALIQPLLVLDRNALTLQYQTMLPSGAVQTRIMRYPLWIGVLEDNINFEHPVSANMQGLDLYWASPIELLPPDNVTAVPLFTSTREAWLMAEPFHTSPETPFLFEKDAADTRGVKILAASLSGEFPGFFRGLFELEDAAELLQTVLPTAAAEMPSWTNPSRIIVVGDTDFTTSMISATGAVQNLEFLLRAADWLTSDDDIITIRNRQPHIGRLNKIIDPQERSRAIRFIQIVNVGLIPLFVIIAGLYLSSKRRARSRLTETNNLSKETQDGV